MRTKNIDQMIQESRMHVASNRLAQHDYQTCIIGCLSGVGRDRPDIIEARYGVPRMLIRLIETVYERLPLAEKTR